jgi:hypothetical protein
MASLHFYEWGPYLDLSGLAGATFDNGVPFPAEMAMYDYTFDASSGSFKARASLDGNV